MSLTDSYQRRINYLRLSVTDRCNMRCRYCMPPEGVPKLSHEEVLSYEELFLTARAAVAIGIEKIRITGGEPLVRKGIVSFLEKVSAISGLKELVLTTNGLMLPEMALDLKKAGVQRLNISLDSLKPGVFSAITRGADLKRVLAGIEAAEGAGFPLKLNMVVMRGINDEELADFAALTLEKSLAIRFIEYMPAVKEEGWRSLLVPGEEILRRIASRFSFREIEREKMTGPARIYRIEGAVGTIGVITAVSRHFCGECNRIRITSSGKVRNCLFADAETDLRPLLREGDETKLTEALKRIVGEKPRGHCLEEDGGHSPFAMSGIGG